MLQTHLDTLYTWFDTFVATYRDIPHPGQKNIQLKIDHSKKVCSVMNRLTSGENMHPDEVCLAGAVALLHDVGRFPQYRRWGTFRDSDSDNHARMAIEVIRQQEILQSYAPSERLIIEEAVRFHNLLALPLRYKSSSDRFIRLIRDADKLDIWRVFVEHFEKPEDQRASAVTLGFPDIPEISTLCLEQLFAGRVVRLDSVVSVNDFKLLLLSWVYDLNFASSYRLLVSDGYCDRLTELLPQSSLLSAALASVRQHISRMSGDF